MFKLINFLDYEEISNMMEYARLNKPINWETGEGIGWVNFTKEEMQIVRPVIRFADEENETH